MARIIAQVKETIARPRIGLFEIALIFIGTFWMLSL